MRIQPINTLDDLDNAIESAERDQQSRWYVARVAQALGASDRIPSSWNESQKSVTTFRELSDSDQEAVAEQLSAIAADVEDFANNQIGMDDLEDAALAASAAAGDHSEHFEMGLVASLGVFTQYGKISESVAEAIVAAAKKPRKVRTQAGVRRFKQPIGTVILPGGKVLKPGDAGYDAANKAAGGGDSKTESGRAPKARINSQSSKPGATTKSDSKPDVSSRRDDGFGERSARWAKMSPSERVADIAKGIGLDNLPDEDIEYDGVKMNAKKAATHVALEGGTLGDGAAKAMMSWLKKHAGEDYKRKLSDTKSVTEKPGTPKSDATRPTTSRSDLAKLSDDDLESYARTAQRNYEAAIQGGPNRKSDPAQVKEYRERAFNARAELYSREIGKKSSSNTDPSDAAASSSKDLSQADIAKNLAKKHGVSETLARADMNSHTSSLKNSVATIDEIISQINDDLKSATGMKKSDLEADLTQRQKQLNVLKEIIASREAGDVTYMRTQDVPVDKLSDTRLATARDQAARRAKIANRPSWKREALADVKKYDDEIARRKSSGDNDYSKMSDSELKSKLDLAAAAVNAGDASLFDKGHAIKQELKRRGIDYKPNSASSSTEDRKADVTARAAALGDKSMTPGRLNQRIRTVNKHLKGVQDRIQARKDRGLNPTKAQLRDEADLKNQLKELNARKSDGGSGTSASSASPAAASPSTASPNKAPSAPATAKQSLNSSAQTELADFADKMGKRLDSVNVKSLDKFINASDDQIDSDLKSAARRLKVAHDNLKKSKRKNRNSQDKMTDVRNYSEARDHARKLLEKSKNKSGVEKDLGDDSSDRSSKPAPKSRIAPATSEYKTTDIVPHSITKKVQQQFAGSGDRPDAKDIMTLNDYQLGEMMDLGFEEDYYDEGIYKIFGTAESWAEYYARQQGITLSPEQRERVGKMVLGSQFRSTENMSRQEYGDYMIDANDGLDEANKKLDAKLRRAGQGESGDSGKA